MEKYSYIKDNLIEIEKRIQSACENSARSRDEITLIAVTKTFEMDIVNASLEFTNIVNPFINDVAENKPQEIENKYPLLSKPVNKHLIGHLQRNKVKKIVGTVDLIHSVDSIRLIEEIDKRSKNLNLVSKILLQVNIGEEEQKFGFSPTKILDVYKETENYNNIEVLGLMAMAPFFEEKEKTRIYFKKMKKIFESCQNIAYNKKSMKILSMGMSSDFEVAIEEGSTMIRVGSAIYGNRDYNK